MSPSDAAQNLKQAPPLNAQGIACFFLIRPSKSRMRIWRPSLVDSSMFFQHFATIQSKRFPLSKWGWGLEKANK